MQKPVLLYGANGYTGRLILERLLEAQIPVIIAGRSKQSISVLANEFGVSYRVAILEDADALNSLLEGIAVVIHAAGPFAVTAAPMMAACLRNKVHYTDITGEIGVFEYAHSCDGKAKEAGIMLLPGCGFDVVPTDSMAAWLHEQLPDATHFELAFASSGGGMSHGTASSMVAKLGEGGAIRKDGKIIRHPLGKFGKWVDFDGSRRFVMSIPWGDVATAYYTTGIPNIVTYIGMPVSVFRILKLQGAFNWLLRTSTVRKMLQRRIDAGSPGPDADTRSKSSSAVVARVSNPAGSSVSGYLKCPDGYTMTALSVVVIVKRILSGNLKTGFQTPAGCYGHEMVLEIPGVSRKLLA